MIDWKAGEAYRVYYAGFYCEYDILSDPQKDRRGDLFVEAYWRKMGLRRLYQDEITNSWSKINASNL